MLSYSTATLFGTSPTRLPDLCPIPQANTPAHHSAATVQGPSKGSLQRGKAGGRESNKHEDCATGEHSQKLAGGWLPPNTHSRIMPISRQNPGIWHIPLQRLTTSNKSLAKPLAPTPPPARLATGSDSQEGGSGENSPPPDKSHSP
ncbi:sprouty-related, EVH1 domain-containing protein 3 [Platysternon megacephalum]|uniref:Sprouty-related, EVH1 domain-containing protein 3 n=1 Tax=Platysternon megacephalum TaxID=55544 RepID=A0A4D9DT85_9SAUR|nr:sprouty-related, EVH1 domain-containing protein 3 [Platysternon megacephalum]